MESTHVIDRVHFTGKWVEFWFQGLPADTSFHDCAKAGKLWDCITESGLLDKVVTGGLRGWTVVFDGQELIRVEPATELEPTP